MNTKRKLRLFIQLSLLGALSMGITSTHDAVAFAAASSISQVAEFHNRMQETADNGAITILPINRAKFWAGQRFDFEVEFPKNSTNFNVGINGEGAEKVFGKKAIITDYGTHISYRINNVTFDKIGEKRVTASASGLSGRLQAKAAYKEENGKTGREAVRVYGDAKWPTFVDENHDGYPDNPDPDVTLAVQYANAPDHYENYRFQPEPTVPATTDAKGNVIANPKRAPKGARLVQGDLPTTTGETSECHSADDVVLMAQGPGSEYFHGIMDNTEVFFGILRALGVDAHKGTPEVSFTSESGDSK